MNDFYRNVTSSIGILRDDVVLVVCGGPYDSDVFADGKFINVTISNVDHHDGVKDLGPFPWEYQDAEAISRPDKSVDWTVVNAGLHHCSSPHKALCEMLRVSRKGVLVLESRDNLLMRGAVRLGLTRDYELEPALLSGGKWGGYRNSEIPNFVYRWTENEFRKTISSFDPTEVFKFQYHYSFRLPLKRLLMSKSLIKRLAAYLFIPVIQVFKFLFPRQGNLFAMVALRTGKIQPWLNNQGGSVGVDLEYIENIYDKSKYKRNLNKISAS